MRTLLPSPSWLPKLELLFGAVASMRFPWARRALEWVSGHTGVPAILVAAILIVVFYRLAKWSARFVLQVSVVLVVLVALAHFGLLRF